MSIRREAVVRYGLVAAVVVLVAGVDLGSKRWVERNLANGHHLLAFPVDAAAAGTTAGDLVRARFPELADGDLGGSLFRVVRRPGFRAEDPVYDLDAKGVDAQGFFVFDGGEIGAFARRIERYEPIGIERWLQRARPDLGFLEARKAVRARLKDVTLSAWLAGKLPHLSQDELAATLDRGLVPVPKGGGGIAPTDAVAAGDIVLLGTRDVVLVPGHLDLSYAENPNGAWGFLADLDAGTRRAVFYGLSALAIVAIAGLLLRPPTRRLLPMIALGGVLGGAIGNLVDRLSLAYVVDFIHMFWGDNHWPRYNVADVGITVGVCVLVLVTGFRKDDRKSAAA